MMIPITFVNEQGDTVVLVDGDAVPRIGETVTLRASSGYSRIAYQVKDVEWPVVDGPNGTYLQVFVTLTKESN